MRWIDAARLGWEKGLFRSKEDAHVFHEALRDLLLKRALLPEPRLPAFNLTAKEAGLRKRLDTLALEDRGTRIEAVLPIEHEERLAFIHWKKEGDIREASQELGRGIMEKMARRVMDACDRDDYPEGFDPEHNAALAEALEDARSAGVPEAALRMAIHRAQQGYEDIAFTLPEADARGRDGILTSVSLPDSFVEAALTAHESALKTWDALAEAIWMSGEPGVIFRDKEQSKSKLEDGAALDFGGDADFETMKKALRTAAVMFRAMGQSANITLCLPHAATVEDVQKLLFAAWEAGVARLRLYREGGTLLHAIALPVVSKADEEFIAALRRKLS